MEDQNIRMQCLQLATALGGLTDAEILALAQKYYDFVVNSPVKKQQYQGDM